MPEPFNIDLINEESFKDLFDNAHDLVHFLDVNGSIIYVNNSWCSILGYSIEEISGKPIYHFIATEDHNKFKEYRQRVLTEKAADEEITIRFISKLGKIIFLEGFVSLRKKNNKPFYTRGIFRDITIKVENELTLKERENNLQQLLLHAPDAVVVIDELNLITFWNPKAEKLFGWKKEEVIGQPLSSTIVPSQYKEAHNDGMKRFIRTGEAHVLNKTIEITAVNKSGEEFYISLTIATTTQNNKRAFIAFIRDIREQKKNEEDLKNKTQQLLDSNEQLEQFAHVASHDMKEPIRKIKVFTGMLESELGASKSLIVQSYFNKINSASDRLLKMVEGVLNYASARSVDQDFAPVNLNKIVDGIITDLEVVITNCNAKVIYTNLPVVNGIDFLIYQLFYNLLTNALKFSKKGVCPIVKISSEILSAQAVVNTGVVGSSNVSSYTQVKVSDNGIGFKPESASQIFKTFTRLNNRADYDGTGLGLSLCESIMNRHLGLITAEGHEGVGATFTVYFPNPG